ncbi:hypothetical protein [Streptomyces sp. NBC_00328]|nr:hypothetical protein [Streptomyces sp. NBC_00328]
MSAAHQVPARGGAVVRPRVAFARIAFLRTPSQQYVYEEAR